MPTQLAPCAPVPLPFPPPALPAPHVCLPCPSHCPLKESLYAENASWADPWTLEQQLARTAEKRKRGLSGEELKVVKQRKQELKEKKRREWLLS